MRGWLGYGSAASGGTDLADLRGRVGSAASGGTDLADLRGRVAGR
jgi:hypothetical protein